MTLFYYSKQLIKKYFSQEEIKIDWDISLIIASLCEIKFDGKIRAMELFMDTNTLCKVYFICFKFIIFYQLNIFRLLHLH